MKYLILSGGLLTILVAVFHTRFYSIFGWIRELEKISESTRRILYTIHLALLLLFLGIGLFTILFSEFLSSGSIMALTFNGILFLFWAWRTFWQLFYFKPPKNRRLIKMRRLHYLMVYVFFLLSLSYFIPFLDGLI